MKGSIFDLEGMYRIKDAEWLRYKIENFVQTQERNIHPLILRNFLESDEIKLIKDRLDLNDADLVHEIQIRSNHQDPVKEEVEYIIKCEGCGVRIRLKTPIGKGTHICPRCKSEFKVFLLTEEIFIVFLPKAGNQKKQATLAQDPYKILGLDSNCDIDTIKEAYRKKLHACHPDKVSEMDPEIRDVAEKLAKKIILAYKVIMQKRGFGIR